MNSVPSGKSIGLRWCGVTLLIFCLITGLGLIPLTLHLGQEESHDCECCSHDRPESDRDRAPHDSRTCTKCQRLLALVTTQACLIPLVFHIDRDPFYPSIRVNDFLTRYRPFELPFIRSPPFHPNPY
jgi:hypothetical protein